MNIVSKKSLFFTILISMLACLSFQAPLVASQDSQAENTFPYELGAITHVSQTTTGRSIIHIQDAHCYYPVQQQIARIISYLQKHDNIEYVFIEGADTKLNTSSISSFPDDKINLAVADYFLKEGKITGVEYLSITSDNSISVQGIEERKLYQKNYELFAQAQSISDDIITHTQSIKKQLASIKQTTFSSSLLLLEQNESAYLSGDNTLRHYIQYLIETAKNNNISYTQYTHLTQLIDLISVEKYLNHRQIEQQKNELIALLQAQLSDEQKVRLLDATLNYSLQKLDSQSMFQLLAQFSSEIGIQIGEFEALARYIDYLDASNKIDIGMADREIYILTDSIKDRLCTLQLQRDLIQADRFLQTVTNMSKLSSSNDEIKSYHDQHKQFITIISNIANNASDIRHPEYLVNQAQRLLDRCRCFESFYDIALKRDSVLVSNTIAFMEQNDINKAILISGGFHAQGICNLLAENGFNVATIKPRTLDIRSIPSQYTSNILGKRNALEQYLLLKWNTLAVAVSLIEGTPLAQEWKADVYRREFNIMQLVLKLAAIREQLQTKLGITTADQLTDAIAATLASQLNDQAQSFLELWKEQHLAQTGKSHPFAQALSIKVKPVTNELFLTITLNDEDITFPINNRLSISPGAIVNTYLTPEKFAAIVAGNATIRESVLTIDQLREMRKRVNHLLVDSQPVAQQITDEDTLLLATIIKAVMTSQSPIVAKSAQQLTDTTEFPKIAQIVNKAIFERQMEQLSRLLSSHLSYERLTQLTRYGSASPLHVLMREVKQMDPPLSAFAGYTIDHFDMFSPSDNREDIASTLLSLHDQYLAEDMTGTHQPVDALIINFLSKLIHASLKFGDAIRPHGIASTLAYSLHPFDDATIDQMNEIHELLEQESIYSTNEVIMLLFYAHWLNPEATRVLIQTPLSFQKMISLLNSEEWKSMRSNPSPYSFGRFVRRYAHLFNQPTMVQLFARALPPDSPLRSALINIAEKGWDSQQNVVDLFGDIAAKTKTAYALVSQDSVTFDMILFTLRAELIPELTTTNIQQHRQGEAFIASFDKIDPFCKDLYDESLSETFFEQAKLAKNINIFTADLNFPYPVDSIELDSGIRLDQDRYRSILQALIQNSNGPIMLFCDNNNLQETQDWVRSIKPTSIVILLPYDTKARDLALTGEKRLSFVGYRLNLIDQLSHNYRNRLILFGLPKDNFSWFDNFSRDTLSIDHALIIAGNLTNDEKNSIAQYTDQDALSLFIPNRELDDKTVTSLIENPAFKYTHAIHLLQNNKATVSHKNIFALASKLSIQDMGHIFASVHNMRSALLFSVIAQTDFEKIQWILSRVDASHLASIVALSQKLGFKFSPDHITEKFSERQCLEITQELAAISPSITSNLLFAVLSANTNLGTQIFNTLAHDSDHQEAIVPIANDLIYAFAENTPDLLELLPFINSDITPAWHKAFVISHALTLINSGKPLQPYIYAIVTTFNEDGPFVEWIQSNIANHPERVNDWLVVVSLFPESDDLRTTQLLTSAIKTDMHILTSYREFIEKVASQKEPYKHLRENAETFPLVLKAVNATFAQPIETKMFVFHIIPYINEFVPQGMSMKDIFDRFVEKMDVHGVLTEPGIPLYAILPALILAEKDVQILESIKEFFSGSYISGSYSIKQRLTSNFLRIFDHLNQGSIYSMVNPESPDQELFIEALRLETAPDRRREIFESFVENRQFYESLLKRFTIAAKKQRILKAVTHFTNTKFTKKDQKLFPDILDFLFILSDNYHILQEDPNQTNLVYDNLIDSIDTYHNVRALYEDVMKLFAHFIQLDFPDIFDEESDIIEKLPRIEKVTNYWLYRSDLQAETPRGNELLRQAIEGYLKNGLSLKHIKYGGTEETQKQLAIYEAVLTQNLQNSILAADPRLTPDTAFAHAREQAQAYISAWQRDMADRIDLSSYPELKSEETIVAWTSDEVPDWMQFGLSGGGTCLAPGNISSYTKNLPGYIFSALVTGGLYFGKYKGDIRDRVNQALIPVVIDQTPHMFVVNQFYYSSGGPIAHDIGLASLIAAVRNAAQFGAYGVVIPTGSPQASYLYQMEDFLQNDFSTVVERRDASGKIIARERVTIKSMQQKTANLIVPREPNQFRYFDASKACIGSFYEKMNENFSFVDFNLSVPHEIAGIQFDGLEIETPSIMLVIEKEPLPLDTIDIISERQVEISQTVQDFISQGRLMVLSETKPELRERFETLITTEKSTGKYLNQLLFLSEQLSQEIEEDYIDRSSNLKHMVVSISQWGLPVARKLTNMLDGVDYVTVEIDTSNNVVSGASHIDPDDRGTVFLVDEGILTGSTAVKNIETILQSDIALPEEIVFVALTADPSAIERLMRIYPDLRVAVGTFESRVEKDGAVVSPLLTTLTDKTMQIDLSAQTRVKVSGVEYKLLHKVQRGDSFVAYLAESPAGEHVFLKTTVSKDEGERFSHIWDLVKQQPKFLGVPKVHQYDEETGVLVLSQISGPTLRDYILESNKNPEDLLLDVMDALNDILEVARFLSGKGVLYVNITRNNVRLDPASGKWFITNYSPFPYRVQPLSESGVVEQVGWIIAEIAKQFEDKIAEDDQYAHSLYSLLLALSNNIQNEHITTIDKLTEAGTSIRHALLSASELNAFFKFQGTDLTAFYALLSDDKAGRRIMDKLHNSLRSKEISPATIRGTLELILKSDKIDTLFKQQYFEEHFDSLLKEISSISTQEKPAVFMHMPDYKAFFTNLASSDPLSLQEIRQLASETKAIESKSSAYLLRAKETINRGQNIVLAGNLESVKWLFNMLYKELGEQSVSSVFIIPELSRTPLPHPLPAKLFSQTIIAADHLVFHRTVTKNSQTIIFSETSLLEWIDAAIQAPQIHTLSDNDLRMADHLRLRMLHNPRLNISITDPEGNNVGFLSGTTLNLPDIQAVQSFPSTTDKANALYYYSLNTTSDIKVQPWFNEMLMEIEYQMGLKLQYAESFQYFHQTSLLSNMIQNNYISGIAPIIDITAAIEKIHQSKDVSVLEELFPNADPSMKPYIKNAIQTLWTDSAPLLKMLTQQGEKQFISSVLITVIEQIIINNPDLLPDTGIYTTISKILGIAPMPLINAVASQALPRDRQTEIDDLYNQYVQNVQNELPQINPLSKEKFQKLTEMPDGTDAFDIWINHHYPAFSDLWNQQKIQHTLSFTTDFLEIFGTALLLFANSSGRTLMDTHLQQLLLQSGGIVFQITDSDWLDPYNVSDVINAMGTSILLRIPYLIGSEEDYLFSWFNEHTAKQLRTFLDQVPEQVKEQIVLRLISLNLGTSYNTQLDMTEKEYNRFESIELVMKSILNSPITTQRQVDLILSALDATGIRLITRFGTSKHFYVLDADLPMPTDFLSSHLTDPDTVLLLIGDSDNVTAFYNELGRRIATINSEEVIALNQRIIGLREFISVSQKEPLKTAGRLIPFALQDDTRVTTKLNTLPLVEFKDPQLTPLFTSSVINQRLSDMLGAGGVLSQIVQRHNISIDAIRELNIIPFDSVDTDVFLKISITTDDAQFDSLARLTLHEQIDWQGITTMMQRGDMDTASDPLLMPVNILTRRSTSLSPEYILEVAFYTTLPNNTAMFTNPLTIPQTNMREQSLLRQAAERITRLYLQYGVIPETNAPVFLRDDTMDTPRIYLITDITQMMPVINDSQFLFSLFKQGDAQNIHDILYGILDAFDGNIAAFSKFTSVLQKNDFERLAADAIIRFAQNSFIKNIMPPTLRQDIAKKIAEIVHSGFNTDKPLDLSPAFTSIAPTEQTNRSIQELNDFTARMQSNIHSVKNNIEQFTSRYTDMYLPGIATLQLDHLRSLQIERIEQGKMLSAEDITAVMDKIRATRQLTASQLIMTKIAVSRQRFVAYVQLPDGRSIKNPAHNPALLESLDSLMFLMRSDPANISKHLPLLAKKAALSDTMFYSLTLPLYDVKKQTAMFGQVKLRVSQLPLLLRAETVFLSQQIALIGNSSSLNFQLFEAIQSLFNLPSVSTAQLLSRVYGNYHTTDPEAVNTTIKTLLQTQERSFAVDTAIKDNNIIVNEYSPSLTFDMRQIDDIGSFLYQFTLIFDTDATQRISPRVEMQLLTDNFPSIATSHQTAFIELLHEVMRLRILLRQAVSGKESDIEAYFKHAKNLGITNEAQQLLLDEQLRTPSYTICAQIMDAMAQSGGMPQLADMLDTVKNGNAVDETKFYILTDIYSSLAIEYFSKKIAALAATDDVSLDVDMGLIKFASDRLVELGEDHSFVLDMLASAKIHYKTFERGTPVETIIAFTNQVKSDYPLFARDLSNLINTQPALGAVVEEDTVPDPLKYRLPSRQRSVIESSL